VLEGVSLLGHLDREGLVLEDLLKFCLGKEGPADPFYVMAQELLGVCLADSEMGSHAEEAFWNQHPVHLLKGHG
jgi:hypothetical protein